MEKQTGSKLGKEYVKAVYCHPVYNLYAEYIMQNAGLDESQAEIKISRRNISNFRYADDTTLMAKNEEKLKTPLDEGEWGEWKVWLKTQHSKNEDYGICSYHFMEIDIENVETVSDFIFMGSSINADMVTAAKQLKETCFLEE